MPFGALPGVGSIPEWLLPKPFRPGYTDPTKPMPGESQIEFDMRRAALSMGHQVKEAGNSLYNPMKLGADIREYMTAPATGGAGPKQAPFQQARVNVPRQAVAAVAPSSAPLPFSAAAVSGMADWVKNRGGTVTSEGRSAQHNKDVGGVGNSYHLTGQAFDSVPPKGLGMGAWKQELSKKFAGWDVINEGDHVHIEPPNGAPHTAGGPALQAFRSAADAVGLNQPAPGFDNSGYQTADATIAQLQQNTMRPFGATYNEQPLPALPAPEPLQAPDYTAGNAAFEAARPKNPFGATPEEQAKGALKMRRADYFSGMAQAMASIDFSKGLGLGELFAKLGAGAIMGSVHGDKEVQARMDKFDEAMQGYNMALANRNDSQATAQANIANQNIQGMNQYKRDLWSTQVTEIEKHNPRVQDGVLITFSKNADGTTTQTHTPIDPARTTALTLARANNAVAAANAHNEYSWQTYRMNRELGGAALPYAMADATANGNTQGRDGIFAVGISEAANAVVETGRWKEMYSRYLGGARAEAVEREAYANVGLQVDANGKLIPGQKPSADQQEAMNAYISSQVLTDFVNSKKSWALVGGDAEGDEGKGKERKYMPPSSTVQSSVATTRERDRKTRRSVDSKGRVTTSESF